jgi:hypothetical protein
MCFDGWGSYAVTTSWKHHHLKLSLHLPNHELLVQPVCTSQHEQARALRNRGAATGSQTLSKRRRAILEP